MPSIEISAQLAKQLRGDNEHGFATIRKAGKRYELELPQPCHHAHANPERRMMRLADIEVFPDLRHQRSSSKTALAKIRRWGNFQVWAATEVTLSARGELDGKPQYAIVNGQHTIEAARAEGVEVVPVSIHSDLSPECEAFLFTIKNTSMALGAGPLAKALLAWGEVDTWTIRIALAEYGMALNTSGGRSGTSTGGRRVGAVFALRSVLDNSGQPGLETTIRWIVDSYGRHHRFFNTYVIRGMGNFFNAYVRQAANRRGGHVLVDEVRLVQALKEAGFDGISIVAKSKMKSLGGDMAAGFASAMVDTYNKGLAPGSRIRLPSYDNLSAKKVRRKRAA